MMIEKKTIDRLISVPVRNAWPNEARDFTPWLAEQENIALLGDALGLSLEVTGTEVPVGPFYADIVALDRGRNLKVVVENQLERTDHRHLGQVLTYAARLEASVVVWIATEILEEHRAAIDWLNHATTSEFKFFAIAVRAVRIGDSNIAPVFEVVARPNDWTKVAMQDQKSSEAVDSPKQNKWRAYWSELQEYTGDTIKGIQERAIYTGNWQTCFSITVEGVLFAFNLVFPREGIRVEAYLSGSALSKAMSVVEANKAAIETDFGNPLELQEWAAGARVCFTSYNQRAAFEDTEERQRQFDWLADHMPKLISALVPIFRKWPEKLSEVKIAEDA
jgi:hypothetical protein